MSKKLKLSRELMYVLGLILMPFSIAIMTKANFGLSMIAAPTYIISEKFDFITYGQAEYVVQALVLVLMCIVVGKFKWAYLTSFATAVIYGSILDLFIWLLRDWTVEAIWLRVVLFVLGMVLTSIGVCMFLHTYLAPCAYDYFVKTVVEEKHFNLQKVKLINDFTYLVIALVLTLVLFKGFVGVTWGTIVIVICNGNIISFVSKQMDKHIEFFNHFPKLAKYF